MYIAIHMSTLHLMATAIGYMMPDRLSSSVLTTVTVLVCGVVSGVPIHFADLKKIPGIRVLSTLSPTRYLMLPPLQNDHAHDTLASLGSSLVCHKQVTLKYILCIIFLKIFSILVLFLLVIKYPRFKT